MSKKLPKHIVRLIVLLGFFLLLALAAKYYLTDPSFYKYGHYRADAIPELAAGEPVYKGAGFCLECHKERKADWSTGTHVVVQCEVCHGIYRGCPENGKAMIPVDTIRLCSTCHEAMPARPKRQPQIVLAEHPFPDEEIPRCQTCHNPHSPTVEELAAEVPDADAQADIIAEPPAHLTAAIAKCVRCHGKQGQGRRKNPPIAGMESGEFIEKMRNFKAGTGEKTKMDKYAKPLSDEEIVELALYYEGLPASLPEETPE
jgi:cytochrome c553